jgi:tetratricopeptide (TPR) repeat protein
MASVFLSYSRNDTARVGPLATALEQDGHQVWWDEHITGGHEFAEDIEQALGKAELVVVLWSKSSVKSAWVRDEAASGRDSGRLIPISLDGSQPPLGFRQYQTIDGRNDDKLLSAVERAIAERLGEAPPAPTPVRHPRVSARHLTFAGSALLLVVGGVALLKAVSPAHAAVNPTVALSQFTNLSPNLPRALPQALGDEIQASFGTEHQVSLVTGSRSASFLLDGSIQDLGDALRFTVNLKNQGTGGLVWSRAFDRLKNDPFAPRQVAVAVAQVVRCGVWGVSAYRKRMSDQALASYVEWCSEYWGGSPDEDRMLDAARRVTVEVPDFSFAWSALALSAVPVSHDSADPDAAAVGREGWRAAQKAIALDPHNPEGYMAEAGLLPMDRFAERERLLRTAISVRPTECGCERQSYGDFLTSIGRNEEAVEQYDRARAMMPLAPMSNVRLAQALDLVGRHDEARSVVSNMLAAWPDAEIVRILEVKSALWTGAYGDAVQALRSGDLDLRDDERTALLHAFQALQSGNANAMAAAAKELGQLADDPRHADRLVVSALAALKAYPAALTGAGTLIQSRGPALADVLFDPNLVRASGTPEYASLVGKLGLISYWRTSSRPPDICDGPQRPSFCSPGKGTS